jgi:hypothetical protein
MEEPRRDPSAGSFDKAQDGSGQVRSGYRVLLVFRRQESESGMRNCSRRGYAVAGSWKDYYGTRRRGRQNQSRGICWRNTRGTA